jgi:hypothetical protein
MNTKNICWIILIGVTEFLSACNEDDGFAAAKDEDNYKVQLVKFTHQYLDDKATMDAANKKCEQLARDFVSHKKEANDPRVMPACMATITAERIPKIINLILKPEPYPDKDRNFFCHATSQTITDELEWCNAYSYSRPHASSVFSPGTNSCNLIRISGITLKTPCGL